MNWLFIVGVLLFILVLLVTVAIHEAGHMTAAKLLKLDVPQYSVGFGPKLFSKKTKNTEYHLRAIPLGGFVTIHDNRYPEKSYEREALSRVAPWKRQIVFLAGPAVNLVVGVIVLVSVLVATPYAKSANYVGELDKCNSYAGCAAEKAGMVKGDEIVSIDGIAVKSFEGLGIAKADKSVLKTVDIIRDGKKITINNLALHLDKATNKYYIGIQATKETYRSVPDAWTFVVFSFKENIKGLLHIPEKAPAVVKSIVTGHKEAGTPGSVVAAGKTYGDVASNSKIDIADKAFTFIYWSSLFNIGIGLVNLLPFLPLDGGRMWIALCDSFRIRWSKIRKKEYNPVTQTMFTALAAVSAIAVFGFMGLIILSDISAIASGNL